MGYSYDMKTGRLACDGCSAHSGVRKVNCPFGYCPAPALCKNCRIEYADRHTKAAHESCRVNQLKWKAQQERRKQMIDGGEFLRCSAMSQDCGRVKVAFQGQDSEQWYLMDHETYDAIPLLTNATPQDYSAIAIARGHGALVLVTPGFYQVENAI